MRTIFKDAPPYDSDDSIQIPLHLYMLMVKKKGLRQQYCDNPDCQRLRKRRNRKDFYDRAKEKKIKKDQDDEKEESTSL